MLKAHITAWKKYPATMLCIMVSIAIHVSLHVYDHYQIEGTKSIQDARWKLGAIVELTLPHQSRLIQPGEPVVSGPFDLWVGQWWKLVINGFHHGDLFHLVMNVLSLMFVGALVEPRIGKFKFLIFILLSTVVSILSQILVGDYYVIGISGSICALFGVLIVLRKHDEEVAEIIDERLIKLFYGFLFLGILINPIAKLMGASVALANVAHFSGLFYGWLAGVWFFKPSGKPLLKRFGFLACHVLLIPAFHFAMHPVRDAHYHWYQSIREHDPAVKFQHIQRAIEIDPGIPQLWVSLAEQEIRKNDLSAAWNIMLQGLLHNRSYQNGVVICQKIWRNFRTEEQRQQAITSMEQTFGEETLAWQERLKISELMAQSISPLDKLVELLPEINPQKFRSAQSSSQIAGPPPNDLAAPPVDPEASGSAAEGISL